MHVETPIGSLHVEVSGGGPPVVLWHSLLCDGQMWREQVRALSDRYRLINIDGPGHGRSSTIRRAFSLDDCVEAALRVLDAAGAERAAWCGLSWGGMVGMRLALAHPERLRALAVLDSSARAERPLKKIAYHPLNAFARSFGPRRPLGKILVPLFFSRRTLRERPALAEQFIETVTAMDRASVGHAVDAVVLGRGDITGALHRIEVPTLVMVGRDDRATPPGEARRLAELIPNAELLTVDGAAHLSALERPDIVNPALERFLGAHAG